MGESLNRRRVVIRDREIVAGSLDVNLVADIIDNIESIVVPRLAIDAARLTAYITYMGEVLRGQSPNQYLTFLRYAARVRGAIPAYDIEPRIIYVDEGATCTAEKLDDDRVLVQISGQGRCFVSFANIPGDSSFMAVITSAYWTGRYGYRWWIGSWPGANNTFLFDQYNYYGWLFHRVVWYRELWGSVRPYTVAAGANLGSGYVLWIYDRKTGTHRIIGAETSYSFRSEPPSAPVRLLAEVGSDGPTYTFRVGVLLVTWW